MWRALSDPTRTLAIPAAPPNDFDRTLGWWAPCIDLMIYELGWQSPARALTKWMGAGRPPTDVRLSLIETVWGRHLDAMSHFLWHGHEEFEWQAASLLSLAPLHRPDSPPELPVLTEASTTVGNPTTGGSDPLHLTMHCWDPLVRNPSGPGTVSIGTLNSDPQCPGPTVRSQKMCNHHVL